MFDTEIAARAQAAYPGAGTLRVHPAPEVLPTPEPDVPGENRFDDPVGRVPVRYSATRLVGCLSETMARFRPNPAAEVMLAVIQGIDNADVDWPADDTQAMADWLSLQRVGTVRVLDAGFYVDVEQADVHVQLNKHPLVRKAVEKLDPAAQLDVSLIRLGGLQFGRPISQAVSTAVRDWIPNALGIAYFSRLSTNEPCWATWSTTHVEVTSVPLSRNDPQHREAVRVVAAVFEIALPDDWS
ncbi:MAG: hypothetical protein ACSLFB_04870 [Acidimicrobiales bacterium]